MIPVLSPGDFCRLVTQCDWPNNNVRRCKLNIVTQQLDRTCQQSQTAGLWPSHCRNKAGISRDICSERKTFNITTWIENLSGSWIIKKFPKLVKSLLHWLSRSEVSQLMTVPLTTESLNKRVTSIKPRGTCDLWLVRNEWSCELWHSSVTLGRGNLTSADSLSPPPLYSTGLGRC